MSEIIDTEPKLFADGREGFDVDGEALARINRLLSLQQSILRRPGVYKKAFLELGEDATAERLNIHDDAVETRGASSDPKHRIREYFAKRDDMELRLDEASDDAIFGTRKFRELSAASRQKKSILRKTGVMKSELVVNPEAQKASDAVRRYILGEYIGRAVLFDTQQSSKKVKRAG